MLGLDTASQEGGIQQMLTELLIFYRDPAAWKPAYVKHPWKTTSYPH